MKILISAISAKMGGAANYMKEIARQLAARETGHQFIFLVPPEMAEVMRSIFPEAEVLASEMTAAAARRRIWFDQITLRRIIHEKKVDVLYSSADFGMINAPCRQVLLVRNPTYFFATYLERYYRLKPFKARMADVFRRWLVCQSVRSADIVITPSEAMLNELRRWVVLHERKGFANLYGVNHGKFSPTKPHSNDSHTWRLLFVSLYTDHKNLVTLLEALKILVERGADVHLNTTADPNWPAARTTQSWKRDTELADSDQLRNHVNFALRDPASAPKNLYSECEIFVYPSVVESFGHALAEAMSSGLPIVAADVPINRELCQDAAVYFSPFDAEDCADKVQSLMSNPAQAQDLRERALKRSRIFSWDSHVDTLLSCFNGEPKPTRPIKEKRSAIE